MPHAAKYRCLNCQDERRVCAEHPRVAWGEGQACCGAEGAPCPASNPYGPDAPPGFVELAAVDNADAQPPADDGI